MNARDVTDVTLEICLDSLESAIAAREGGASRLELCGAMGVGGLTPSFGLLRSVRRAVPLTLHVLVRPREGDFCYSAGEIRAMSDDILAAKEFGADGIVTGVLTAGRTVDVRAMRRLLRAAAPLPVTFHRAFDDVRGRRAALESLVDLGVARVLTSGGRPTAFEGRKEIGRTVAHAAGRIAVMAGGGIGRRTVAGILEASGVGELHVGSAVAAARTNGRGAYRVRLRVVDAARVRSFLRAMRSPC
jgi:copper homeostasis protein